jgi:farnesyl-diphosphate farnesyltransferase
LNDLITDALAHVPDCLTYMSRLRNQKVFNFCAIPQVMAVATLAECYANHGVFLGPVKIRRGLTAKMVDQSTNMATVQFYFAVCLDLVESKIPANDPNRARYVS